MSQQMRPRDTLMTVCDLCGEPLTDEQQAKRASLSHGYAGHPDRAKATAWYLLWDPRNWPGRGGPTWEDERRDPKRWGTRHYDFHTECLLRVVEAAMAKADDPDADLLVELAACTTNPDERRARLQNAVTIAKAGGIDEPTLEALLHLGNVKAMTSTAARALRDVGISLEPWGPQ